MAIAGGVGWHLEKETGRYGPLLMAQLKLKDPIWEYGIMILTTRVLMGKC